MSRKTFTKVLSYFVLIVLTFGILTITNIEAASYGEYLISLNNVQKRSPSMMKWYSNSKRGGDLCGCNMGCFYRSFGACSACCSLGI
uniref:Secreted protein n=1 Tax=Strongyloides stercoralis TaxID=6248 RepID=A0A0K0E273_STRER